MNNAKKPVTGPKAPPRTKIADIIKRYLKEDKTPVWTREYPIMYKLFKAYPSLPFWERHGLPFRLNIMTWFLTIEGKATLASDYAVFHYHPPAPEPAPQLDNIPVDNGSEPRYNEPLVKAAPNTVAGFLAKS